ncbi:MAG: T9SS type A sorting domain-containing protein [Rhodothermales bacterium]
MKSLFFFFLSLFVFLSIDASAQTISVALPDTVTQETTIDLPVVLGDATGLNVVAFNMVVSFDSTIIAIDSVTTAGFMADGMILTTNFGTRDRVVVAGAGAAFLSGGGVLLELHARFVGAGQTDLRFERFTFNEGSPQAEVTSGKVSNVGRVANEDEAVLPAGFLAHGNYPNPFSSTTTVRFDLPATAPVTIDVYDVLGRRVAATATALVPAGKNREVPLTGLQLPAGMYIYRLRAELPSGERAISRLMTIIR